MSDDELLRAVAGAIASVGVHRFVPVEVTRVERDGAALRIAITLRYRREQPVCCGEPGCYLPFLGRARHELPRALARALGLPDDPAVSIAARLEHDEGYRYESGIPSKAVDCTIEYDRAHFSA